MALTLAQAKSALSQKSASGATEAKSVYRGPGAHALPNPVIFGDKKAEKADGHGHAPSHHAPVKKEEHHEEERHVTPMFIPMDVQKGEGHDDKPVHVMDITTRGHVLGGQFKSYSEQIYRNYLLCLASIVLCVASAFVNIYVAAVFAYLAGHFHSERLVANAWEIEWWKGKSVVYTK